MAVEEEEEDTMTTTTVDRGRKSRQVLEGEGRCFYIRPPLVPGRVTKRNKMGGGPFVTVGETTRA
jgi:hypothetical protein